MNGADYRRLTLMDAMIVVAAVAVSFAWTGWSLRDNSRRAGSIKIHWDGVIANPPEKDTASYARSARNQELLGLVTNRNFLMTVPLPFLITFTPALLLMRLRQPRPRCGVLVRQPGAVACTGGLLTIYAAVPLAGYLGEPWELLSLAVVPTAWATLAVSGWWRSEPSWLDRVGRAVGVCWIAAAVIACWLWSHL